MAEWDEQTDVIAAGSGLAGLAAAIEAAKSGCSVIVFEKMKIIGGNTRIADGALSAAGNFQQKKRGIEDSPELFYNDMLRAGLGLNHPQLARIVAERSADTVEWTQKELGVAYQDRLDRFGGHTVARSVTTRNHSGVDIIKAQSACLKELGVEIRTRCQLTGLITDETGTVRGIKIQSGYSPQADHKGPAHYIRANRAVVLATGGFGNDISFRSLQDPRLDQSVGSTNHRGATAEGLVSALKINAAPVHLSWIQTGPWCCANESGYGIAARFASYCVYPAGILVDPATGQRIVNEWGNRKERSDAIIDSGHACIGIVDAAGAAKDPHSLEISLKNGKVKAFAHPADLARKYEIPVRALEQTLEGYNRKIVEGLPDTFGKPLHQGVQPITQPPYYAVRLWPKVHYTPGGVAIDTDARVIDLDNRPIRRLFAAGEVCGGIHGASRLGGCALPECLIFGRIAGQNAARELA